MESKILQAVATLEEQVQIKTVDKAEEVDKVSIADFSYSEYPNEGFLRRVCYGSGDTYVFDLKYINRVGSGLDKVLVGGDGVDNSLNFLKNVYGINEDFTVWYIDENGKMYGASKIVEVPIDVDAPAKTSDSLKQGMGVEGDLKVGDVRGRKSLVIDGNSVTGDPITNLNELSFFPNLTSLTLKNLTLTDLNGLEYSLNIEKLWLDNTKSSDYSGLSFEKKMTGFYPINNSVDELNMAKITDQFPKMTALSEVRMRNNSELKVIPELKTLGSISTLYIEENENLTNIYGLSTVSDKTKLINLYLNENNLTDVVKNEDTDETYGYIIPKIQDENVINMSYIDGYTSLKVLNCSKIGGEYFENGERDTANDSNKYLKYLCGVNSDGKNVGITSIKSLNSVNFEYCDILDIEKILKFKDFENVLLTTGLFLGNENLKNEQVYYIASFLVSLKNYSISGRYVPLLDANEEVLNYKNFNLSDLSFLEGNEITTELYLSYNSGITNSQTKYIGEMTQLELLDLSWCDGITNFSFLSELPNLKYLYLDGTLVTNNDMRALTCKDKVLYMTLYNCYNLSDVNILNEFPHFGETGGRLDLRGWANNGLTDLSALNNKHFKELLTKSGDLTTCQSAISNFNQGYGMHFEGRTNMLQKIESCSNITYLKLSSSYETSWENVYGGANDSLNLSRCTQLAEVYFMRTSLETLNLTGCSSLSKVTIIDMGAGSRWIPCDFSKNTNLTYLNLDKNYLEQSDLVKLIDNLTPGVGEDGLEKGAKNISEIILNRNNFSSLKPFESLAGKTSEFSLQVQNNQLITLEGIENLTQLTSLDISENNGITNIKPILDLKSKTGNKLTTVTITGCTQITDSQKSELKSAGVEVVE